MPKMSPTIIWIASFFLFLFAACVWPTIYRYDKTWIGEGSSLVRMNRITGETEILFPDGWENADSDKASKKVESRDVIQPSVTPKLDTSELRPFE